MFRYTIILFLIFSLFIPVSVGAVSDTTVEVNGWSEIGSFISFMTNKLFDAPNNALATIGFALDGLFAKKPEDVGLSVDEQLSRAAEGFGSNTEVLSLSDVSVPLYEGDEDSSEDRDFLAMLNSDVSANNNNEESSSGSLDSKPGDGIGDLPPSSWDTDHYNPDVLGDDESDKKEDDEEPQEEVVNISWCEFGVGAFPDRSLMVNEVAWMGTDSDPNQEWIEIKNKRSREVSLSGYQLVSRSGDLRVHFSEQDSIPPYGYYLILRGDESDLGHEAVDKVFDGSIRDSDEELRLFDESCGLVDKVDANTSWPGGNKATKNTMIRSSENGWRDSARSGGTPGIENSSPPPEDPLP